MELGFGVWMGFYEMFVIYIGSNDKSLQKIIMGNIIIYNGARIKYLVDITTTDHIKTNCNHAYY